MPEFSCRTTNFRDFSKNYFVCTFAFISFICIHLYFIKKKNMKIICIESATTRNRGGKRCREKKQFSRVYFFIIYSIIFFSFFYFFLQFFLTRIILCTPRRESAYPCLWNVKRKEEKNSKGYLRA